MLKARKKITKREIKEDPLVNAYVKVQRYIQKYNKAIAIVLVSIMVLIGFFWIDKRGVLDNEKRAQTSSDLTMAQQFYFGKDYDRAIQSLTPVTQEFEGTTVADEAVFYLANSYYEKGMYADARTTYEKYLSDYGRIDYFKISSLAGIAACNENEKNYMDAAKKYEQAANEARKMFYKPFYLRDAARCYVLAEQKEKGKELIQQILKDYPDVSFSDELTYMVESL
jgi:TolA-binding protein